MLASMLITNMAFGEGVKCRRSTLNLWTVTTHRKHTDTLVTLMSELPQRIKVHLSERVPDIGSV